MKTTRTILVSLLSVLALVAVGCDSGDGTEPSSDDGNTEATTVPNEDPIVDPTEDPVVDPTEDPVVDPTEDPVVDPTEDPVVDPNEDPVVDPNEDPVVDPTEDPVVDPNEDPVVDPTEDPVVLPELPDGPGDAHATKGCANLEATPDPLVAGSSESEAGQVLLVPGANSSFLVQLPESGVGYVTVEIPDWQVIVAVFAHHTTDVKILDPEGKTAVITPLSWNSACADTGVTDQRTKYHTWGSFTFELTGEPGSQVWLSLIDYEE
jgi:hypothetical protein